MCAENDPIKAATTTLSTATAVVVARTTPSADGSDLEKASVVMERAADGNMSIHYTGVVEGDNGINEAIATPEAAYVKFAPGIVDGLRDEQWVRFEAGTPVAEELAIGEKMDSAVTGEADLGGGLKQIGNTFDEALAESVETKAYGDRCFYHFKEPNSDDQNAVYYTIATDAEGRLGTIIIDQGESGESFSVTTDYDPVRVLEPAATDVAPAEFGAAYIEKLAKNNS